MSGITLDDRLRGRRVGTSGDVPDRGRTRRSRTRARFYLGKAVWVLVVGGVVVTQQIVRPSLAPIGIIFIGVVLGSLTALVALGISLIYRADRIINFAQGDLGGVPAVLAVLLIGGTGIPYPLAVLTGLVAALTIGALVEIVFMRRFFKAPRLIVTVATIGVAQILTAGEIMIPPLFHWTLPPMSFPSPFNFTFFINPIVFKGTHVLAMVVVPIAVGGLAAFFRYTNVGIAVRASAENMDRAQLLGVPVKKVHTTVWIIATVLAFTAMFLRAGMVGLGLGNVFGPAILLRALAPVVIARMVNLPAIFVASLGLGVVEQVVLWHAGGTAYVDAALFGVILLALLVQRRGRTTKADEGAASSWQAVAEPHPVPRELRSTPEVKWGSRGIVAAVALFLVFAPAFFSESNTNLLAAILILGVIALSLVVLTGWGGQVSLGQMTFAGIGAAIAGAIASTLGWDPLLVLGACGLVGAGVAVLVGLPALRIRGLYLAVTTLALGLASSSYFLNLSFFEWLPDDRIPRTPLLGMIHVDSEKAFYYFALLGLALAVVIVHRMRAGRRGRILIATRENEWAAQAFGVNLARSRVAAFAISGFIAAYGGALLAYHQQSLETALFTPAQSLKVFTMVVIGGLGSIPGALVGAAYVRLVEWFLPEGFAFLASGVGLLLVLMIVPGGLGSLLYNARDRGLRWVANRRGILVPSLIADLRVETFDARKAMPERLSQDGQGARARSRV